VTARFPKPSLWGQANLARILDESCGSFLSPL
jgi:hypothetical protein